MLRDVNMCLQMFVAGFIRLPNEWGWPVMRRRRCQSGHPSVGRVKIHSRSRICLSTDDFVSPGAPRIPLGRGSSVELAASWRPRRPPNGSKMA